MKFKATLQNGLTHTEQVLGTLEAKDMLEALQEAKVRFGTPNSPCCLSVYPEGSEARLDVVRRKKRFEALEAHSSRNVGQGTKQKKEHYLLLRSNMDQYHAPN